MKVIWLIILAAVLAAGCGERESRSDPLPEKRSESGLMPSSGEVDGWIRSGPTKLFNGAELYGHINGGAEIFLDLGFELLEVQKYADETREVTVDIYHMIDRAAAAGIYLMKCGEETPSPGLAARHSVNQYQLLAVAGSLYVSVTDVDGRDETGAHLVALARPVLESIPELEEVDLFAALPRQDRIPGSERIIRGQFTLQAMYTLGPGDILLLGGAVTGVGARYGSGGADPSTRILRILIDYPSAEDAREAFDHLVANLDSYLEVISNSGGSLIFEDYAGKYGLVALEQERIDLALELPKKPE